MCGCLAVGVTGVVGVIVWGCDCVGEEGSAWVGQP